MNLEDKMLSEIGQVQEHKYFMIPLIWVISVKFIKTKNGMLIAGIWGREKGELLINRHSIWVETMNNL